MLFSPINNANIRVLLEESTGRTGVSLETLYEPADKRFHEVERFLAYNPCLRQPGEEFDETHCFRVDIARRRIARAHSRLRASLVLTRRAAARCRSVHRCPD